MRPQLTREDYRPMQDVGHALYLERAAPSEITRWRIWTAAGLPAAPPPPGKKGRRRHTEAIARAVDLVDDMARTTEMMTEERNSAERQAELEAQLELFWDARCALREMLGWPQWGCPEQ